MTAKNKTSLIERGLQTFLHGFSTTRSMTHPYPVRQLRPSIWVLADTPRTRGSTRNSEVIVYGANPEETLETIQRESIGRHALCVLLEAPESAEAARDRYKEHGYRLVGSEALFVLPIDRRIDCATFAVRRVIRKAEAETIGKAARGRQLLPEHLNEADAPIRLYGAFDNDTPIGWVSSVRAGSGCNWVANLFVHPDYRRRGIGKSLMSAMLNEDAAFGAEYSALLASKTGALLYPQVGYEQHGVLLIFMPRRDAGSSAGGAQG
jgi:predicted N-acetyltransferase YhbS